MGGFFDDAPSASKGRVIPTARKIVVTKAQQPRARVPSLATRPSAASSPAKTGDKKRQRTESLPTSSSSTTPRRYDGSRDVEARLKKARKREDDMRVRPESDSDEADPGSEASSLDPRVRGSRSSQGDPFVGRKIFSQEPRPEGSWEGFCRSEDVVLPMLDKYVPFFPQEGFEKTDPLPYVELVYPVSAVCKEKFLLLVPRSGKGDAREYSPLSELVRAIHTVVSHYIPITSSHIFGPLPSESLFGPSQSTPQRSTPLSSLPGTPSKASGSSTPQPQEVEETILRSLHKSINRHDGPGFVAAVTRFNEAVNRIREEGGFRQHLETTGWGAKMKVADWEEMVDFVHDQAYSRVVGPFSNALEHPVIPDGVSITDKEGAYGELRHRFMSKIIQQTRLGPESTFVDLGSGVGNCVLQAALQAGCSSYGWELLPVPSKCARLQVIEVKKRWAMWGLEGNLNVETIEGDFRDPSVAKKLKEADVVLVNNEVFPSSLNHDLTHLFLELRDGATVVSLKPFQPEGFRLNDSNCDSFAAILRLTAHDYQNDWVSWKSGADKYYVQVIDRSLREQYDKDSRRRRG